MTTTTDGAAYADRRKTPRYPFVAIAEFSEAGSGKQFGARVREIGMCGCYLETPYPLPQGAQLALKIFKGTDFLESSATVAYSQPDRGMGIQFREVKRHFLSTLQKWLLEAMRGTDD